MGSSPRRRPAQAACRSEGAPRGEERSSLRFVMTSRMGGPIASKIARLRRRCTGHRRVWAGSGSQHHLHPIAEQAGGSRSTRQAWRGFPQAHPYGMLCLRKQPIPPDPCDDCRPPQLGSVDGEEAAEPDRSFGRRRAAAPPMEDCSCLWTLLESVSGGMKSIAVTFFVLAAYVSFEAAKLSSPVRCRRLPRSASSWLPSR